MRALWGWRVDPAVPLQGAAPMQRGRWRQRWQVQLVGRGSPRVAVAAVQATKGGGCLCRAGQRCALCCVLFPCLGLRRAVV